MRDNWVKSDDGKQLKKKLTKKVAANKHCWGQIGIASAGGEKTNVDGKQERTHIKDQIDLKAL